MNDDDAIAPVAVSDWWKLERSSSNAKLRWSAVATVAKTKQLKQHYGAEEGEESSHQFWKEPSRASGSSFQRAQRPSRALVVSNQVRHAGCFFTAPPVAGIRSHSSIL